VLVAVTAGEVRDERRVEVGEEVSSSRSEAGSRLWRLRGREVIVGTGE